MDQFVVDVGDDRGQPPATRSCCSARATGGEPTAQDWADALGTIHYEIVTRIGARVPRSYPTGGGALVRSSGVPAVVGGAAGLSVRPRWPASPQQRRSAIRDRRRIDPAAAAALRKATAVDRSGRRAAPTTGLSLHDEEVGPDDAAADRGVRARVHPQPAVVPVPAAGARRERSATGSGRSATTSAGTAGRRASATEACTIDQLGRGSVQRARPAGADRAGAAGRSLDGRHDR